jgi:hypothetical protein
MPVPVAAQAAVEKWIDANIFGTPMPSDERAQLIYEMKQVQLALHCFCRCLARPRVPPPLCCRCLALPCLPSLALDGAHCAHSPPLTPNPRRCKERLRLTHLSTRRMTKR